MNDSINRQAAIEAVREVTKRIPALAIMAKMALEKLPPEEQPEIIHCKDCKYSEQDEDGWWHCIDLGGGIMGDGEKGNGFCSDAERKEG